MCHTGICLFENGGDRAGECTNLQKVKTKDGDFIKVSPCPEDAKVIIKKYSSETTTRHEKVVKKGRDAS